MRSSSFAAGDHSDHVYRHDLLLRVVLAAAGQCLRPRCVGLVRVSMCVLQCPKRRDTDAAVSAERRFCFTADSQRHGRLTTSWSPHAALHTQGGGQGSTVTASPRVTARKRAPGVTRVTVAPGPPTPPSRDGHPSVTVTNHTRDSCNPCPYARNVWSKCVCAALPFGWIVIVTV